MSDLKELIEWARNIEAKLMERKLLIALLTAVETIDGLLDKMKHQSDCYLYYNGDGCTCHVKSARVALSHLRLEMSILRGYNSKTS